MLAELHGKIKMSSEDNLIGNVFGTLRYVSFNKLMKPILLSSIEAATDEIKENVKNHIESIESYSWNNYIKFWPYDEEGELDLILDFPKVTIGVEVKYNSGMSDWPSEILEINSSHIKINNEQLHREARIIKKRAVNKKAILILLARKHFARDIVRKTSDIADGVNLCYIGWEDFLEALKIEKSNNKHDDFTLLIINDLINFLILKGFERFRSFDEVKSIRYPISQKLYYNFSNNYFKKIDFINFYTDISKEDYYEYASRK